MSLKTYLLTCAAVTVITAGSIMFVPGLAGNLERELLTFFSTNSR